MDFYDPRSKTATTVLDKIDGTLTDGKLTSPSSHDPLDHFNFDSDRIGKVHRDRWARDKKSVPGGTLLYTDSV